MSLIYARLINQCKFRYQILFSARIDKQDEDDQVLDENEIYVLLNVNQNSTQTDNDRIVAGSHSEQQIQNQGSKDSSRRFDENNSITYCSHGTTEL